MGGQQIKFGKRTVWKRTFTQFKTILQKEQEKYLADKKGEIQSII